MKEVRIVIPQNPSLLFTLAVAILAKHTALGATSPLLGFGEAGACGVLTQTGMTNGYPESSIAGGYTLRYGPTPNGPSRYWILANVTDEWFQSRYDNGMNGAVITGPVGTIS